jgi:hypothetical protein
VVRIADVRTSAIKYCDKTVAPRLYIFTDASNVFYVFHYKIKGAFKVVLFFQRILLMKTLDVFVFILDSNTLHRPYLSVHVRISLDFSRAMQSLSVYAPQQSAQHLQGAY